MKRLSFPLILLVLLCICSCDSTQPTTVTRQVEPPPPKQVLTPEPILEPSPVMVKPVKKVEVVKPQEISIPKGELLSDISVSASSFNPNKGGKVAVQYTVSRTAEVEISFYDPDFMLVKTLKSKKLQAGKHELSWDGKDMDETVVPDEAYFFTVTAKDQKGKTQVYDPTAFSGGVSHDIVKADIDPETKVITYRLPEIGRVLIRLGVHDGPLLNTLVDWKPRIAGAITEHWNGKDRDNLIDLFDHPRFQMLITYFTLPEHSVITYGNNDIGYRDYKDSLTTQRHVKQRPEKKDASISPHYHLPRTKDYSPKLKLEFSNIKDYDSNNIPILQGKAVLKVEFDEKDISFFVDQQYEITLFIDSEFYTEQELGYDPYNWVWDLNDVKEGEHVITVNMLGFKDQMGVLSKKIKVIR